MFSQLLSASQSPPQPIQNWIRTFYASSSQRMSDLDATPEVLSKANTLNTVFSSHPLRKMMSASSKKPAEQQQILNTQNNNSFVPPL